MSVKKIRDEKVFIHTDGILEFVETTIQTVETAKEIKGKIEKLVPQLKE